MKHQEQAMQVTMDNALSAAPLCRNNDPISSAIAAEQVIKSGQVVSHAEQVLAAVRAKPGRTSGELAILFDLDRHEVARRLPGLRDMGRVQHCPNPVCDAACKKNGRYCGEVKSVPLRGRRELRWWPRTHNDRTTPCGAFRS